MKALIIICSFLLEGVMSNFVPLNGFLAPLFTLVSLIIIYPLFDDSLNYYKYVFITGLAYDLIYTNTIVFHALIFCFMAFLLKRVNLVLSDNYFNVLITIAICILVYRTLTYGLLVLVSSASFSLVTLIFSILKSLIINLLYGLLLFYIVKKFPKKDKYKI